MKPLTVVSAASPGWQEKCWNLAKSKTAFQVNGLAEANLPFLKELCGAYDFKMTKLAEATVLTPKHPD